jgi:hypothetical protein
MRGIVGGLTVLAASALAAGASEAGPFDGTWQTTVSCAEAGGGLGYAYRFDSVVRDGVLHGLHGHEGEPGSLTLDGTIGPDGAAKVFARGRTGSPAFVPGRDTPRGTDYGYDVEAHFQDSQGAGARLEGRPCQLRFEKR